MFDCLPTLYAQHCNEHHHADNKVNGGDQSISHFLLLYLLEILHYLQQLCIARALSLSA